MPDRDLKELTGAISTLAEKVGRLDERAEARHTNMCDRIHGLEASVDGVRSAQEQHGLAVAALQSTCSARLQHCSGVHEAARHRANRQSDEVEIVQRAASRIEGEVAGLRERLGEVRETSQVSHRAELERAAAAAAWRRVGSAAWKVGKRLIIIAAGLGLLGGGAAALVAALK